MAEGNLDTEIRKEMSQTDGQINLIKNLNINEYVKDLLLKEKKDKKRGLNRQMKRLKKPKTQLFRKQVNYKIFNEIVIFLNHHLLLNKGVNVQIQLHLLH